MVREPAGRRCGRRPSTWSRSSTTYDLREILLHTLGVGIDTEITAEPKLPPVLADKGQLETVLINLVTNARDAMGGKGLIRFTARKDVVTDAAGPRTMSLGAGSYIRITVGDHGIGMDANTLERVCEPFFTTKPAGQGTGLGLAMAHGFAGQSGGGLHIESAPGKGTTVTLWLPIAGSNRSGDHQDTAPATATMPNAARLLLVDDDAAVQGLLGAALRDEGFTVRAVATASEALDAAAKEKIDLLIADLCRAATTMKRL